MTTTPTASSGTRHPLGTAFPSLAPAWNDAPQARRRRGRGVYPGRADPLPARRGGLTTIGGFAT